MIVKLKRKVKNKWENVPATDLLHQSLVNYIANCFEPCAASVHVDDKLKMIISNTDKVFQFYEEDVLKLLAADMINLLGSKLGVDVVLEVFEGSDFYEIKTIEPPKEDTLVADDDPQQGEEAKK